MLYKYLNECPVNVVKSQTYNCTIIVQIWPEPVHLLHVILKSKIY